jgi:hypothetical protein
VFVPVDGKTNVHGEAHHEILSLKEGVHEVEIGGDIDITAPTKHDVQIDIDVIHAEMSDV